MAELLYVLYHFILPLASLIVCNFHTNINVILIFSDIFFPFTSLMGWKLYPLCFILCFYDFYWVGVLFYVHEYLLLFFCKFPVHTLCWFLYLIIYSFIIIQRRQWHPTPVLLPRKSHGRSSLVGCRPWGREESDMTERLHFHFSLSCIGEGNGNPLQCSCLENPRDGGAWWAAIYGVAQSWIRLKWLSSSSSMSMHYSCMNLPVWSC